VSFYLYYLRMHLFCYQCLFTCIIPVWLFLLPVSFTYIIPVWLCLVICVFYLYYPRMTLSCYMCLLPVLSPYYSVLLCLVTCVFYLYNPRMTLLVLLGSCLSLSCYLYYPCMYLSVTWVIPFCLSLFTCIIPV
jgi:hypothetical protein